MKYESFANWSLSARTSLTSSIVYGSFLLDTIILFKDWLLFMLQLKRVSFSTNCKKFFVLDYERLVTHNRLIKIHIGYLSHDLLAEGSRMARRRHILPFLVLEFCEHRSCVDGENDDGHPAQDLKRTRRSLKLKARVEGRVEAIL